MPVTNPSASVVSSVTPAGILLLEPEEPDFPLIIPGPQGPIGPQGPSGGGGNGGGPTYVDLDHYEPEITVLPYIAPICWIKRASGIITDAGPYLTWLTIIVNSTPNTTIDVFDVNALILTITGVTPGTYRFRTIVKYQTAATTTGIGIRVGHTGTTNSWNSWMYQVTTGTTATNGIGDSVHTGGPPGVVGHIMEGYAMNTSGASGGFTIGVDGGVAGIMAILEGVFNVSVAGSVELRVASEIAGSGVECADGTHFELAKIA